MSTEMGLVWEYIGPLLILVGTLAFVAGIAPAFSSNPRPGPSLQERKRRRAIREKYRTPGQLIHLEC